MIIGERPPINIHNPLW